MATEFESSTFANTSTSLPVDAREAIGHSIRPKSVATFSESAPKPPPSVYSHERQDFYASWQMLVIPRPPANNAPATPIGDSEADEIKQLRFDLAENLLGPVLGKLNWQSQVGWHLSSTWEPNQSTDSPAPFNPNLSIIDESAEHLDEHETAPDNSHLNDAMERRERVLGEVTAVLSEAAHDVRAPITAAQQIISAVTAKLQTSKPLQPSDFQMLEAAGARLRQADRWAERILSYRQLRNRRPVNIRKRFYPAQWKTAIEPLLASIAQEKGITLEWTGWDRSLPRLYLDPDHLSRAMVNLVQNAVTASPEGGRVAIRAAWQTRVMQRLVIVVEDEGAGLSREYLREVNASAGSKHSDERLGNELVRKEFATKERLFGNGAGDTFKADGLGLGIAKRLIESIDGGIAAQLVDQRSANKGSSSAGGTLFRISLPVDNFHSIVRGWLLKNMASGKEQVGSPQNRSVHIHVIRAESMDLAMVDQRLQIAAGSGIQVIRVSQQRWLWLELVDSSLDQTRASQCKLDSVSREIVELGKLSDSHAECHTRRVFELKNIPFARVPGTEDARYRLPYLTQLICSKIDKLLGGRVPAVDDLDPISRTILGPGLRSSDSVLVRHDRNSTSTLRSHLNPQRRNSRETDTTGAASNPQADSWQDVVSAQQANVASLLESQRRKAPAPHSSIDHTPSANAAPNYTLEDLVSQWRSVQAKLQVIQQKMSTKREVPNNNQSLLRIEQPVERVQSAKGLGHTSNNSWGASPSRL